MSEHKMSKELERELKAAQNMDWMQTVLNHVGGPPCFYLEREGRFCGRAQTWHDKTATKMFHAFTPLASFVERIAALEQQLAEANASLRIAIELTEMIDEFNQVGTDSWVWLQQARMLFDAAPPTKGNEHAESIAAPTDKGPKTP